jgi:Outer membrane protein beta-barrel domain
MNKSRYLKALLVTTFFCTAFFSRAFAQQTDDEEKGLYIVKPREFYGGLVAGANFSQVDGDYYAGYHKVGANVGGIVYARLAKKLALSMEILYTQKGSKSSGAELSEKLPDVYIVKYGINNTYAEVPVMINLFDRQKSHIGIGLSYSRLVNSSESLQADSFNLIRNVNLSGYNFQKNNLDFLAGAQLHLWKGLFFNVRFQYSLIPIRTDIPEDYARSKQYNNMWVVRLMYLVQ